MATTVINNNIERLRKITFIICVPFYACTYKEKGTKRAEKGYQNRDKFFAEIVSILQADGWTLTTMGETLDCGKSTCPELTKGNEHIYCHPEELTGEVQDEKAFAEILKGAASFRIVKKEAGDIYVCADNEEGKQLYRDKYRDCIDEVIRDVVYLKTNIYGGRKGDWIDLDSATRIIGERVFIATKSNSDEYNSVTVLREYVTEELCRLQDAGRIEATTNQHGQTVIKWADERTLAYTSRCKELEAEALAQMPYKVGDTVKSRDGVTGRVVEMYPEVTGDIDSPHLIYEYDGKPLVNVVILDADGKRHCAHWSFFTLQEASEIKDIPAADLCWDMDEDGVKVWGNIDKHAENLTRMGAKRGRVVFKSNKTGLPTGADCWVLPKSKGEDVRQYVRKVHERISRDFSEARDKYGDKGHKYHEGEKVMTIYGRGTVIRGRAWYASDEIDVQLELPTYNYIWSLLGTPQKMVALNRNDIVSIKLPEPPAEVHIDAA